MSILKVSYALLVPLKIVRNAKTSMILHAQNALMGQYGMRMKVYAHANKDMVQSTVKDVINVLYKIVHLAKMLLYHSVYHAPKDLLRLLQKNRLNACVYLLLL